MEIFLADFAVFRVFLGGEFRGISGKYLGVSRGAVNKLFEIFPSA